MRIVVCVKQVPEVSELAFDPATRRLRRDGVPLQINPFDRRAVLEATRLRAETGGTITVISMGPPQTADALRECLSLGVDRAVHLCDPAFAGADTLATARTLARAIERIGFDLVLGGRFSIDSETGQVGPEIAALLDVPLLSGVRRLIVTPADGAVTIRAECERDDGFAEVECETPVVVTCTDRWKTRVPLVMPDEEAARTLPLETLTAADLGGALDDYGAAGSPTWVAAVQPVATTRRREVVDVETSGLEAAVDRVLAEIASARATGGRDERQRSIKHARREGLADAIWVLAEIAADAGPRSVTVELLGAADALAARLDATVCALPIAPDGPHATPDAGSLARQLGALGADVVLLPESGGSRGDEATAALIEHAIRTHRPRIVLAPATGLGRDVVPRAAARLGLGLTGDAIGVELDREGRLLQLKPAFGGQMVAPILSRTRPEMVTLRPGVLDAIRPDPARAAAQVVTLPAPSTGSRVRVLSVTTEIGEGATLHDARVVVCVGHGLGKDNVELAAEIARALGGAVGATRRVCDVGWLPRQLQIGISGRSVAPDLYIALGVRGSFNHVVGMQRSGRVIAVNRDASAEAHAAADLGIVGDAPSFAAALLARLEASRESSS